MVPNTKNINEIRDMQKQKIVEMVIRQTDLDNDKAREYLEKENYNYLKVIKEWNGIKEQSHNNKSNTLNQEIYKQIRTLMDDSSKNYRIKKEEEEKKKVILERLRKEQEERIMKEKNEKKLEKIDED